tara:strand:+ start:73 stop:1848 length:1776 start_codon:yes stop_codon:yes gene_type:complete
MNEEELDPIEKQLKEAQEQFDRENEQIYDERTKGNEEIRRKRTEDDDEQLELPLESRNLARVGAGLAFEVGANSLLDALTLVPGSQAVGSAVINSIAQGIRGGKFSFGEVLGSAVASQIPGLAQGKAITKAGRITRAAGTGAVSGAIETTSIAAVDEGRLPTAQEFGLGVGAGGVLGAGFAQAADLADPRVTGVFRDLRARIQSGSDSSFDLVGSVGAAKKRPPNFSTTGTFGRARYYESPKQTQKIASELINTWGMKNLTFDFDQYEIMRPKVVKSASRSFGELFESVPYTKIDFNLIQKAKIPALQKKYSSIVEAVGFPARKFQLHHTVPIKGSLPGYDGLRFGSDEWWEVTEILFRNMLRPGNDAFNLAALVGGNKPTTVLQDGIPTRFPTPHSVTHKFLDAKIGPSGELFWTKEVRKKMKVDFEYRKEKWQEYAELVKQSQDITNQAEFTFRDLYEDIPPEQLNDELDLLVERLVDLDDRGLLNKTTVDDNYQVPQMKDIVTEVAEEMRASDLDAALDSVTGRQQKQREFVRKRLIEEIELRRLNDMSVPDQITELRRLTGMSIDDIQLLIQTNPKFDIAKFIMDNQ